eukprot:4159145-Pyramimonas_sp.AAC.1
MDSTSSEIVAMIWALLFVLQNAYRMMQWTIFSDSKITLGILDKKHGHRPSPRSAAFLSALAQE